MSLRARLLVGLVILVALGLSASAIVTYEEQRSFLLTRVDQQVAASELPIAGAFGLLPARSPSLMPQGSLRRPRPRGLGESQFQESATYGVLLDRSGRVIKRRAFTPLGTSGASPPRLPRRIAKTPAGSGHVQWFTVDSRSGSGLRYRVAAFAVSHGRTLVIAVPMREVDQTLHRLTIVELLDGIAIIVALFAVGWIVIRFSLRPLERIGRVASDIAHGDLSRRVSPSHPRTEVGRLGLSLNEMLVRIEQAFSDRQESEERLRQFLADASHELRTPLASIRGYAEVFRLGAADDPEELERAMSRIESESRRMGVLVEDLLLLASLDELPEVRRDAVDLSELALQAGDDTRAMDPSREVQVSASEPVWVRADADQLRQVLANLTRNAVIHTPAGSPIELTIRRDQTEAVLEVRDHGQGLSPEAQTQVFDRFWRNEGGRRRGRGGAGLGLAIVKAIAVAHHGRVEAGNAAGGGASFRLILPLLPAGADDAPGDGAPRPAAGAPTTSRR